MLAIPSTFIPQQAILYKGAEKSCWMRSAEKVYQFARDLMRSFLVAIENLFSRFSRKKQPCPSFLLKEEQPCPSFLLKEVLVVQQALEKVQKQHAIISSATKDLQSQNSSLIGALKEADILPCAEAALKQLTIANSAGRTACLSVQSAKSKVFDIGYAVKLPKNRPLAVKGNECLDVAFHAQELSVEELRLASIELNKAAKLAKTILKKIEAIPPTTPIQAVSDLTKMVQEARMQSGYMDYELIYALVKSSNGGIGQLK
jgi:hypothetical protein